MVEEEAGQAESMKFHLEMFQDTLVRARELEATLPPVGSIRETLAHAFVHIARLYAFIDQDDELKEFKELVDFDWLIQAHIENVRRSLEAYKARKDAGLSTNLKMN